MAKIEYFYSAHSAFAYLGSRLFEQISAGHEVVHRPIDLSKVVPASGSATFALRTKSHKRYYFGREIARWSQWRDAPVMEGHPTHHSNDITLANCMLIAGVQQQLDVQPLAHAMLQSHWRDNSDLADRATLNSLAKAAGFDAGALFEQAVSPEICEIYRANNETAIARSVFGSPTYFVDGDMFYGQDRLELVEAALRKPFAGTWSSQ